MNQSDVKRLALVFSVQAEIEAMKSENMIRRVLSQQIAYGENDFEAKAEQLRNIAAMHNDQL